MLKKILLIILVALTAVNVSAQCSVTPVPDTTVIDCGDSIYLGITGFASTAISEGFSSTGPTDPGWQTTAGAIYTNPYIPSPTNDTYFWMGATAVLPAALETVPFNVTYGGIICFDFVYAVQGGSAPTEGPDLSEEGITLQYSTDGGVTWNDIVYFMPNGEELPSNPGPGFPMTNPPFSSSGTPYTTWNSVCFPIPAGALGPNTSFQWIQEFNSGACCDHWGLDNISIQVADPAYDFYLQNDMSLIDTNFIYVSPISDTTITIMYTNNIDDTCVGSVDLFVNPTEANPDIFICEGVGDTLSVTGVTPWATVTWTPPFGLDDPNSQTPLANPLGAQQTYEYIVTSDCGTDTTSVTYYSVDAATDKDTICPFEFNQLYSNVTGISTACEEDYTVFEIPYYREEGAGTTLNFSQADDGISQSIPMPFAFDYYCSPITDIRVSTNGYVNMSSATFSLNNNQVIPVNIIPNNFVALMWDDLNDSTGLSNYFVTGTAPNRKLVVEFDLVHEGGTVATEAVQGQIIFHETTNFIDVICENCQNDNSDPSASQGIENPTGFIGTPTPGRSNTNWEASLSAYRYMPNTPSANAQTITWTPATNIFGENTLAPIVTPDTTTTYVVQVMNNWDSCFYTDSVTVYVQNNLTIDAGQDLTICLGDTTTLAASSNGDDFLWTPNFNLIDDTLLNPLAYPDTTTTYVLQGNIGLCFGYDTMTVNVTNFIVDSTVVVDEICVQNSGSISIYTSGQNAGLQYSIDGGTTFQASNIFNGLSGGVYNIVVGGANCDTTYTATVVGGANLMNFDSIALTDVICGTPGSISIDVSGGSLPLSFSIDSGLTQTTDTFYNGLTAGVYEIYVEDAFGCVIDSTITLTSSSNPTVSVDSTTDITCFGLANGEVFVSSTGGATPYTYSLDSIVFSPTPNFSNLDTGTYTVYLVDSNNCVDNTTFTITQPDELEVQISVPGNVLCAGGTIDSLVAVVTGGTPDYQYLWSTTETTPTIQSIVFGTYWVEVTDTNNCFANDSVLISQPVPLYLEIAGQNNLCNGDSSGMAYVDTISGGVLPYTYEWLLNGVVVATTDTAQNLIAGTYILNVYDFNSCVISDTITLTEPPALSISMDADTLACYGDNNACATVTVSGGTTPYSYLWSNSDINNQTCNLVAGWYSVTVTDSNACSFVDSVEVIQPDSLSLTTTQVDVSCYGMMTGTATVSVNGGTTLYSYLWNDPSAQNTATASNLEAGNYTVVVTDANLCVDSISVSITQPTDSINLVVDTVIDAFCNGDATGSAQITTIGGTLPYDFSWSNGGGTNEDLTNAAAGNYTLTVTDDNNCVRTVAVTINEPTALDLTFTQTDVSCFDGNDGAIDASASGGVGNYTYSWTGPNAFTAATEDITTLIAGTYTLTVTDSNNCTHAESVTINQPATVVIGFTTNDVNCFGGNDGSITANIQSGGTAPFTYQWDANANNQVGPTATGLIAGTYVVTVTDDNGCSFVDSATIGEPAAPLSVVATGTDITCASLEDGTALATAQGGTPPYSYLWNDPQGQTSALAIDLASNTYQVTVTDANGCIATDTTLLNQPTPIGVSLLADSANCWGDATGSITVLASGGTGVGYSYSIDGGETFQSDSVFNNLPAGNYDEIIVQDIGSNVYCVSDVNQTFVYESPYFSFEVLPGDTTVQLEESVPLVLEVTSPNYTNASIAQVTWFPTTGLNCSDCIDPIVLTYDPYTEYTATVYYYGDDDELCDATSNTIIIVENNLKLFIPNAFTPSTFDDVNSVFEVYGEGIEYITMQIYNRWGEKIFENANQKVAWDGTFKGQLQNPGVYTYYVSVEYLDGKTIDRKGSVTLIR